MANRRNLTIADGQVAATATQITTGPSQDGGRVNVMFANVGTQEETLILTISRNGGTSRRLRRVVLAVNEQFEIRGLPLNLDDSLLAATTNASSVDYVVSVGPEHAQPMSCTYDENGNPKSFPVMLETLAAVFGD